MNTWAARWIGGTALFAALGACILDRSGTLPPAAAGGGGGAAGGSTVVVACSAAADCPGADTACVKRTCAEHECGQEYAPGGAVCSDSGVCDGAGTCLSRAGSSCSDAEECVTGFCSGGVCCDSACDGECFVCQLGVGKCKPAAAGEPALCDHVCDGSGQCASGKLEWSRGFSDPYEQKAYHVAADSEGAAVFVGSMSGGVDFGGGALVAGGGIDAFVVKLDKDGKHLWSKRWGDAYDQWAFRVAIGPDDEVAVVGLYAGIVDFGGGPLNAQYYDAFVVKLDKDGNHVWSKRFGAYQYDAGYRVAFNSAGDVLVAGIINSAVDFGTGPVTFLGGQTPFVLKLHAKSGQALWAKAFGDYYSQIITGLAVTENGDIWLGGDFEGSIDFGGGPLKATYRDAFIAKLDQSGNHLRSAGFSGSGIEHLNDLAPTPDGGVAFVGDFDGNIALGSGTHQSEGGTDLYLARVDASGKMMASMSRGGFGSDHAYGVAVDRHGNVLVTGDTDDPFFFVTNKAKGVELATFGLYDLLTFKVAADGTVLWVATLGGAGDDHGYGLAAAPDGSAFVTGFYTDAPNYGDGELPLGYGAGAFLLKLAP